jgi:hypothetical protein
MTDTWEETRDELTTKRDDALKSYTVLLTEAVSELGDELARLADGEEPSSDNWSGVSHEVTAMMSTAGRHASSYQYYIEQLEGARSWFAEQEDE